MVVMEHSPRGDYFIVSSLMHLGGCTLEEFSRWTLSTFSYVKRYFIVFLHACILEGTLYVDLIASYLVNMPILGDVPSLGDFYCIFLHIFG
jgi:hypothetical protein